MPIAINNPEVFEKPVLLGDPSDTTAEDDEERYGVDFPDTPEAPLITEDPLLDDPVTSGSDASVLGRTTPPTEGGK